MPSRLLVKLTENEVKTNCGPIAGSASEPASKGCRDLPQREPLLATPIFFEEHHACVGVELRPLAPQFFVVVKRVLGICRNQLEHFVVTL